MSFRKTLGPMLVALALVLALVGPASATGWVKFGSDYDMHSGVKRMKVTVKIFRDGGRRKITVRNRTGLTHQFTVWKRNGDNAAEVVERVTLPAHSNARAVYFRAPKRISQFAQVTTVSFGDTYQSSLFVSHRGPSS